MCEGISIEVTMIFKVDQKRERERESIKYIASKKYR